MIIIVAKILPMKSTVFDGIGFRAIAYDVFVYGEKASYGLSMGMNF